MQQPPLSTTLQITIQRAGDPEKISELLKAALAVQEPSTKEVVPKGYHCIECYKGDGSHETSCSMNMAELLGEPS